MLLQIVKCMGSGLSTFGFIGAGIVIGNVFNQSKILLVKLSVNIIELCTVGFFIIKNNYVI